MRWVLFLFLFGLGFPASVVYEAKLQMPKVDNDAVVQYLNYLYERSSSLSNSLEILERMWEMSKNVDNVQLEDFRVKKQAYQSALSEFASAKNAYIDFIQNPRSYSTLQPATDLQTKLRNLVLRQLELKQSMETVVPALRLYTLIFLTLLKQLIVQGFLIALFLVFSLPFLKLLSLVFLCFLTLCLSSAMLIFWKDSFHFFAIFFTFNGEVFSIQALRLIL